MMATPGLHEMPGIGAHPSRARCSLIALHGKAGYESSAQVGRLTLARWAALGARVRQWFGARPGHGSDDCGRKSAGYESGSRVALDGARRIAFCRLAICSSVLPAFLARPVSARIVWLGGRCSLSTWPSNGWRHSCLSVIRAYACTLTDCHTLRTW